MISITQLHLLPRVSGIYKVVDTHGNVIYIGQSINIYERWNKGHHKLSEIINQYGTEVYLEWVEVPEWLLNRVENTAVSFYQPKLNSKTPPIV
jgi:excinuclease UvrABC nuclease subunit